MTHRTYHWCHGLVLSLLILAGGVWRAGAGSRHANMLRARLGERCRRDKGEHTDGRRFAGRPRPPAGGSRA